MSDEIDNATEAAVLIKEIWKPLSMEARYQSQKIANRVLSVDAEVSGPGDKVHLPITPVITIGDVTKTTGAVANQALTYTEATVDMDQWRGARIQIVDMASKQSVIDIAKDLAPGFGKALAFDIDDYIAGKYAGFTTNVVGSSSDDFSGDMLLAGLQKLIDLSIPVDNMNDISCVLHTSKWSVVKNIDKFSFANYTGYSMGGQMKYEAPAPYGVPLFFTTAIDSSGGAYQNMLFHRQALGLGVQLSPSVKQGPDEDFSKIFLASTLYGASVIRETHGVLLRTK